MSDVIVLGAGPAGLAAALGLARRRYSVTVVEQADRVGGNAGSFELAGLRVDYGSHRFHPAADPRVFALVRELLGDDLLERPRHGRIRLLGRWIHFPLRPADLLARAHPRFTAGVLQDIARRAVGNGGGVNGADTFASVLERGLGSTICREFYFPYARKIWGLEPEQISPIQAQKRVSANSLGRLVRRLVPGAAAGSRAKKGVFFYPRRGFGQICERLAEEAHAAGADIRLETVVRGIETTTNGGLHQVEVEAGGRSSALAGRHIWSTIPATLFARLARPNAPSAVTEAASRLELRAMVLVYLVLATGRFTEFDAHYFPDEALPFTRVSEPKNYAASSDPSDVTVLCAEIPCQRGDAVWANSDQELATLVADGLARAGLPIRCEILAVTVKRLGAAYPIYRAGYEQHFDRIDRWIDERERVVSFGRQGLYAHDNTHHAMFMAHAAVDCLREGEFDREAWRRYRAVFETHVVED